MACTGQIIGKAMAGLEIMLLTSKVEKTSSASQLGLLMKAKHVCIRIYYNLY